MGQLEKFVAKEWFRKMFFIRCFEERSEELYARGKIGGFLHLYIGEEAIAVGALSALEPEDDVVTHYRDHGYALARGVEPERLMAELFGKATGVSHGKGGSMHFADVRRHLWGGYAIVGAHIPIAVGMGFAAKYQKQKQIVACFFGDGATNAGVFFEALNIAALWKIPLIAIVENNRYGMGTAVERASAVSDLYKKAAAFEIPSVQIDGNDVELVRNTVREMATSARNGAGPQFIEAITYRFRGHSMGDPQRYRSRDEVEHSKTQDPITRLQERILNEQLGNEAELNNIRREVQEVVDLAIEFAETSPVPEPAELFRNITAEDRTYAPTNLS
jgi:pyruvate dehydrogenase E1 component alpha subunit